MRILHLEDNANDAELVREQIREEWPASEIHLVATQAAYLEALQRSEYHLILSDFALVSFNGLEALQIAKKQVPDVPFVFLSGAIGEDRAIEALRNGAEDYVLKNGMKRLNSAISRALRESDERKRRRKAESRSRELANFLHQAREAVVVTDLDGRITFWNQGAEQLSGWTTMEALDRNCHELLGPQTTPLLAEGCRVALESDAWTGELELADRHGRNRLMELRISLIRNEAHEPRARLTLATDITERRVAERRIREQAEMLNQAREGIFITDLNDVIIYWNAGAERLFGWNADEIIGKSPRDVFDLMVDSTAQAARQATAEQGQWQGELRFQNRQRETLVVASRQTLIRDDAGNPKARLSINSDITEQKKLEEQFLRAQRMENLGMLAAGIAHDLNNMLAPILLAAPMLRDHVTEPGPLSLLNTLEKSAERGANLVRQILSFAHGASGDQRLVQVKHLLRDIVGVISNTFPKSIRLEDHVPTQLWTINGNPTQIHQVLLNLTVNARDAMPEGGTLTLKAENVVLDALAAAAIEGARPGAFLVLHVADTGTGIPPKILKEIWKPFYTTKELGRGTGLGLSTVRGIIEAHHGFVELWTQLGAGTSFRIYLPATDAGNFDRQTPAASNLPHGRGELILVVDDEDYIREMTSTMLTRHGYRVILASDGADAAKLFIQRVAEIRLVITDLHMPNLDGAMLGRAIRQINPATKTLVISGMIGALGSRPNYRPDELGDSVLHKPFKSEALLLRVHEMLHGAPAQPPPARS